MELSNYIKKAAEDILKYDTVVQLPAQLAETEFFLASAEDDSILAHASIQDAQGVEYKIGPKKQS